MESYVAIRESLNLAIRAIVMLTVKSSVMKPQTHKSKSGYS